MRKLLLMLVVCNALISSPVKASDPSEQFTTMFFTIMVQASETWDSTILKEYIRPQFHAGNEQAYKDMFRKNSSLGKLKSCNDLELTEIDKLDFLVRIVKSVCQFENGNALVQNIYRSENSDNELMGLIIKRLP